MRYDIDTYHDLARPFFDVTLLTPTDAFLGDVAFFQHDLLVGTRVAFSDQKHRHDPSRLGDFDTEMLLLEYFRRGSSRALIDATMTRADDRTVRLMDWSRPHVSVVSGGADGFGLLIPYASVGYDPSAHPPSAMFSTGTARGRLIATSLNLLIEAMARAAPETAPLAAATLGLVRTLMLGDLDWARNPREDSGRRAVVTGYIRRHLDCAELGVDRVCRDLGLSRATLYRAFGEGGVERFIRDERLERCLGDILAAVPRRGVIRQVAERWSFHDPANFGRAFRMRFGFSPSDILGETAPRTRAARLVHPVALWLRKDAARGGSMPVRRASDAF